jgi:flavodoxin I
MKKIGIFYGTSTGQTEVVAEKLHKLFGLDVADVINVEDATAADLARYPYLVLGTPTWGIGDMQDDWEDFLEELASADLGRKKVALFGLGDQDTYPESFADGMGVLYDWIRDKVKVVGAWPLSGYHFNASDAVREGKFVGLVLDQENQAGLTDKRLGKWVEVLRKEFV